MLSKSRVARSHRPQFITTARSKLGDPKAKEPRRPCHAWKTFPKVHGVGCQRQRGAPPAGLENLKHPAPRLRRGEDLRFDHAATYQRPNPSTSQPLNFSAPQLLNLPTFHLGPQLPDFPTPQLLNVPTPQLLNVPAP